MKEETYVVLVVCGLLVFALVFCSLVVKLRYWIEDIRMVKMEMSRAEDWEEYVAWRSEYRVLLLSLIPGLDPERIERIRHYFRRRRKRKKKNNRF